MISAERLREILLYEVNTGVFIRDGQVAGTINKQGYRQIRVDGRIYLAHRLAWLHFYGEWPKAEIDHVNGDRTDNRMVNLRLATSSQNKANAAIRRDNTSGVKGVSYRKDTGKWTAYINRKIKLGCYSTLEEATKVRRAAEASLHGQFARSH